MLLPGRFDRVGKLADCRMKLCSQCRRGHEGYENNEWLGKVIKSWNQSSLALELFIFKSLGTTLDALVIRFCKPSRQFFSLSLLPSQLMTDPPDRLHNLSKNPARLAAELLHHYSFELAGYAVAQQIEIWLEYYPTEWLPLAIIEALYQGRYKAISVEQILNLWQRREHPVHHFNHEFERLICGKLPHAIEATSTESKKTPATPQPKPSLSYRKMLLQLPSIQAASKLERLSEIPSIKVALTRSEALLEQAKQTEDQEAATANGKEPAITPLIPTDRDFKEFKEGVVFGLSSGLAVRALKPRLRLELSQRFTPNWVSFFEPNGVNQERVPEATPGDRNSLKT